MNFYPPLRPTFAHLLYSLLNISLNSLVIIQRVKLCLQSYYAAESN